MQSLRSNLTQQRAGCTTSAVSSRPPFQHRRPAAVGRWCPGVASVGFSTVQQRIGRDACIARAGKGFGAKKEAAGSSTAPTGDCPCGSGRSYQACCGKYHSGTASPESPEALLRSRFTAYKMSLVDYLVATTHPENPEYSGGARSYGRMVKSTARANEFLELKIGEQKPGANEDEALISFEVKYRSKAPAEQGKSAATAQETSRFVRSNGKWLFRETEREKVIKDVSMAKPTLQP